MKIEKVETAKNKYPKFEELNNKSTKIKIGIITALAISFKSRCFARPDVANLILYDDIAGAEPMSFRQDNSIYVILFCIRLLIISMVISGIISGIIFKTKWKKYSLVQKKRIKIILGILFVLIILLLILLEIIGKFL